MNHILKRYPITRPFGDMEKEMHHWLDNIGDLSKVETSDWLPAIDIKEESDQFLIKADVPGVDPANIDVSMDNNILTIKGERESEHKESLDGFSRVERAKGTFYRRFSLPDTADAENIKAKSKHGVLFITIPKQNQKISRKISVEGE